MMTLSGVFSAWARLPTWVRARSTISRLAPISRLSSAASGAISSGNSPAMLSACPRRTAITSRRNCRSGPQAIARLQGHGDDEQERQQEEGDAEVEFELRDLTVHALRGRRDLHQKTALVAGVDVALQHPQRLAVRPERYRRAASPSCPGFGAGVAAASAGARRTASARRGCRRADVEPGDLPVPARKRQFELRLAQLARRRTCPHRGAKRFGDQRAQIDAELLVERRLGRLAIQRRQDQTGQGQDHDAGQPPRRGTAASRSRFCGEAFA